MKKYAVIMQKASSFRKLLHLFRGCSLCYKKQSDVMSAVSLPWYIPSFVLQRHNYSRTLSVFGKSVCLEYSTAANADNPAVLDDNKTDGLVKAAVSNLENTSVNNKMVSQVQKEKLEEERKATEILENLSPEMAKKLKVLKLEYDVWLAGGSRVPRNMTNTMWLKILECESVTSRAKCYKFWLTREIARNKEERKKQKRKEQHLARLQEREKKYGDLYPNRILSKISASGYHEYNLAHSMIHGPHLVFDLSYDDMRQQDVRNLIGQFLKSHGFNKKEAEPFHFHFCSVKPGSLVAKELYKYFVNLENILYTVTEKSYLDYYPRQNIVYLSPYAKQSMAGFSYDDVYVLGGMVDKVSELPLSTAKAKRDKVKCVKLPLDRYLQWTKGSKALTLDQMVQILHTLKRTNDWKEAFKHVPKRKFVWPEDTE